MLPHYHVTLRIDVEDFKMLQQLYNDKSFDVEVDVIRTESVDEKRLEEFIKRTFSLMVIQAGMQQ